MTAKEVNNSIEEYATRLNCPRHTKQIRSCAYKEAQPCECRRVIENANRTTDSA